MTAGRSQPDEPTEPLADQAYLGLRDRIVDGRLPPGAPLRDDELMREMGIGRTPLREAVKRLALEHLVEVRPRQGTQVTDVHAEDIARFAEVRTELEAYAARLAAERLGELREEGEALRAEIDATPDDAEALMLLDERIHRFTWRAAGNSYLEATLDSYFALSLRVGHLVRPQVPELPPSAHQHAALLDAILTGDGERAHELMREHVTAFARKMLDAIDS